MPRGYPGTGPNPRAAQAPDAQPPGAFTMPQSIAGEQGADLLLKACNIFGVNPDPFLPTYAGRGTGPFKELMAWRFYPGVPAAGIPDSVGFVTVGGAKIRHYDDPTFPMDRDTETRLRMLFHAFKTDPKTNELIALPLPIDLTLPKAAVSSQIDAAHGHVYKAGYIRRQAATAPKLAL